MIGLIKFPASLLSATLLFLWTSLSALAIEIQEVESKSGIKALLVEDYTLPIISLSFSFQGGNTQDPTGQEGAVALMTSLLDEGAGDMDSAGFRGKLEEAGIELSFSDANDRIGGSLRTIVDEKETAFELLELALTQPRFDDDALERMRNAFILSLKRAETDPGSVGRIKLRETLFAAHPYGKAPNGTIASVKALDRDAIIGVHKALVARQGLVVGVVGAIDAAELAQALDQIFGDLPEAATLSEVPLVEPKLGVVEEISMPGANSTISLVYDGLSRDHPDFFAAHLVNHILGGGTFSSRLYTEIREKRGLVYGVSSSMVTRENTAFLVTGTSTRAENASEVLELIKTEVAKIADGGITQEELDAAKRFTIGSYAINNLDTSSKIARVLVALQVEDLGTDYIEKRVEQIDAVTLEDIHRVARDLLSVEPTVVIVGPATQ